MWAGVLSSKPFLFHLHGVKAFVVRGTSQSYQVKCNKLVSNSLPLRWTNFWHLMVINMEGCPSPSMLLAAQGFLLFGYSRENSWVGVWKLPLRAAVRYYLVAKVASWLSASSSLRGAMFPLGKHRKSLSSSQPCAPSLPCPGQLCPCKSGLFVIGVEIWEGSSSGSNKSHRVNPPC